MEIKKIERNYGFFNFKLLPKENKINENHYENLYSQQEYNTMKKIMINFCEDRLHFISSYQLIFKILIFLSPIFVLFFNPIIPLITLLISTIMYFYLQKKWKILTQIYSLELTAIDDEINDKYNIKSSTNFDYLGERYIKN